METRRPGYCGARRSIVVLIVTVIAAGCAESTAPEPVLLTIVSGADQEAEVGKPVGRPLVVLVTGLDGLARSGIPIDWAVLEGGGSVAPPRTVTGADGQAETTWTLGTQEGDQSSVTTARDESVTFHAYATPPAPMDWGEVLDLQPSAQVQGNTLRANIWIFNRWPGTVRMTTPHSCLAEGYPALYTPTGERVAAASYGCWTVPTTWTIPRTDSLHAAWDVDIASVAAGEYTLLFRFAVQGINDGPATLPDVETTVAVVR
ncbi:MAG: hypothetical protein ACYC6F_19395 [Longimicrobiales bacterium]